VRAVVVEVLDGGAVVFEQLRIGLRALFAVFHELRLDGVRVVPSQMLRDALRHMNMDAQTTGSTPVGSGVGRSLTHRNDAVSCSSSYAARCRIAVKAVTRIGEKAPDQTPEGAVLRAAVLLAQGLAQALVAVLEDAPLGPASQRAP
jgi:hypothetical protein